MTDTKDDAAATPEQEPTPVQPLPVRVAIDLSDMPDGKGMQMYVQYLPDGKCDPASPSHNAALAIQKHLRELEGLEMQENRKREADMIQKAVLKVCDPVDGPLETMRGPSEANN